MKTVRTTCKRLLLILIFLLILTGMVGCAAGITGGELLLQMKGETPPLVLDVRTAGEYASGHIPGAVNISIFDFRTRFEQLNLPKEKPIIVVCEHGPRSGFAGFVLNLSGYRNVLELEGAMKEWKRNGLPIEK